MDRLRLRKVLCKFRKEELYGVLSEWGFDLPPNLTTKAQIISYVTEESEVSFINSYCNLSFVKLTPFYELYTNTSAHVPY